MGQSLIGFCKRQDGNKLCDRYPTSDGALTATIKCLSAYGEKVKITVTSRDNPNAKAECIADYAERLATPVLMAYETDNININFDWAKMLKDGETKVVGMMQGLRFENATVERIGEPICTVRPEITAQSVSVSLTSEFEQFARGYNANLDNARSALSTYVRAYSLSDTVTGYRTIVGAHYDINPATIFTLCDAGMTETQKSAWVAAAIAYSGNIFSLDISIANAYSSAESHIYFKLQTTVASVSISDSEIVL